MSVSGVSVSSPSQDLFLDIRRYVDPYDYLLNTKDSVDPKPIVNLITCDEKDVSDCIESLKAAFSRSDKLSPSEKIDLSWLSLVFYTYMIHQSARFDTPEQQAKLTHVRNFEAKLLGQVGALATDVNEKWNEYKRELKQNSVRSNQKILMVHHALPYVYQLCQRQTRDAVVTTLPYGFNERMINDALRFLNRRLPVSSQRVSDAEREVNLSVNSALIELNLLEEFGPLKSIAEDRFYDALTKIELDFPLRQHISIETDGPHHYYPNTQYHEPVHNLKALVLRDTGYTRVPVHSNGSLTLEENKLHVRHMAQMLEAAPVQVEVKKFNELVRSHYKLSQLIRKIHIRVLGTKGEMQTHYIALFKQALAVESQYRGHLLSRHLEEKYLLQSTLASPEYVELINRIQEPSRLSAQIREITVAKEAKAQQLVATQTSLQKQKDIKSKVPAADEIESLRNRVDKLAEEQSTLIALLNNEVARQSKYTAKLGSVNGEEKEQTQRFLNDLQKNSIAPKRARLHVLTQELAQTRSILNDRTRLLACLDVKSLDKKIADLEAQIDSIGQTIDLQEKAIGEHKAAIDIAQAYPDSEEYKQFFSERSRQYDPRLMDCSAWNTIQSKFSIMETHYRELLRTLPELDSGLELAKGKLNDAFRQQGQLESQLKETKEGHETQLKELDAKILDWSAKITAHDEQIEKEQARKQRHSSMRGTLNPDQLIELGKFLKQLDVSIDDKNKRKQECEARRNSVHTLREQAVSEFDAKVSTLSEQLQTCEQSIDSLGKELAQLNSSRTTLWDKFLGKETPVEVKQSHDVAARPEPLPGQAQEAVAQAALANAPAAITPMLDQSRTGVVMAAMNEFNPLVNTPSLDKRR